MATWRENKYAALLTLTGLSSGTTAELEKTWLKNETGLTSDDFGLLSYTYLAAQGQTTGTLGERWFAFLGGLGYTGTPAERIYQWWEAGTIATDGNLLLETGDNLLLETGDLLLLE